MRVYTTTNGRKYCSSATVAVPRFFAAPFGNEIVKESLSDAAAAFAFVEY